MTLSEVARETGLTRAAARRFLLTLADLGYVRSDDREFSLRPKVLELGYAYLAGLSLNDVAAPHLEDLVALTRESSSVAVLDGEEIVYVVRVPTKRIMAASISVGTRFPAYATSMGRVLLAHLPDNQLEAYLKNAHLQPITKRTVTRSGAAQKSTEDRSGSGVCDDRPGTGGGSAVCRRPPPRGQRRRRRRLEHLDPCFPGEHGRAAPQPRAPPHGRRPAYRDGPGRARGPKEPVGRLMMTTEPRNCPVVLSAVRTPVGRYGGALAAVRPDDLAALVVREAVARSTVPVSDIEDVYFGAANQAGEDNRNVARMAALLAGLPESVAGVTLNRLCASGLSAIVGACHAVLAGEGDVFVAGGVESMSPAPRSLWLSPPRGSRGATAPYMTPRLDGGSRTQS